MQTLPSNPDRPLSAWRSVDDDYHDDDDEAPHVVVAGLPQAGLSVEELVVHQINRLEDPIRLFEKVGKRYEDYEYDERAVSEILGEVGLKGGGDDRGAAAPLRVRNAPSVHSVRQNVNTVEIVKRNGLYSVVLDGVSQGEIRPDAKGALVAQYWMPRFKESTTATDATNGQRRRRASRRVEPVLFALRLEEYETAPESCVIDIFQSVVSEGTVVMRDRKIGSRRVVPYSTSSTTASATVLPYPSISTPAPHFAINDYSKLQKIEIMLKCFADEKTWKEVRKAFGVATDATSEKELRERLSIRTWRVIVQTIWDMAKGATSMATNMVSGVVGAGKTAAKTATAAGISTLNPGWAAAGGLFGGMAYGTMQMLIATHRTFEWIYDDRTRNSLRSQHAVTVLEAPKQHVVTISELPKILHRIAETRSNGSIMRQSENTIGLTIYDMRDMNWAREAALMEYLMFGSGLRKGAHPVTGVFGDVECIEHAKEFLERPLQTPLTQNTVSLAGMDATRLSNTRCELSYVVRIVEQDGSRGPTLRLDSTRMNGIDAGWIAGGHDESVQDIVDATDYLEAKLAALPGVSRWMRSHVGLFRKRIVVDSNSGRIVADDTDANYNILLGRHVDNDVFASLERSKRHRAEDQARIKESSSEVVRAEKTLSRLVLERKATLRMLATAANPEDVFAEDVRRLQREEHDLNTQIHDAEELLQKENRRLAILRVTKKTRRTKFGNLFDHDTFMLRLRSNIVGTSYDAKGDSSEETKGDSYGIGFWGYIFGKLSGGKLKGVETGHLDRCHRHVCHSLGIVPESISKRNVMVLRFVNSLAPTKFERSKRAMRMTAFLVPSPSVWMSTSTRKARSVDKMVLRTIPSLLDLDFGRTTLPVHVDASSEIVRRPAAVSCVDMARLATTRWQNHQHDDRALRINSTSCHFVQLYLQKSAWSADVESLRAHPLRFPVNVMPASMLPSSAIVRMVLVAEESGFVSLNRVLDLVSGSRRSGVASLLSELRLRPDISSVIALATYADIVACHLLERASPVERDELTKSVVSAARTSAATVARFVESAYGFRSSSSNRSGDESLLFSSNHVLRADDEAFYCIPGFGYIFLALRRLGMVLPQQQQQQQRLSQTAETTQWRRLDREHARRFSVALLRLSTMPDVPLEKIPFTSMQTLAPSMPPAVQRAMGVGNTTAASVVACSCSFDRMKTCRSVVLAVESRSAASMDVMMVDTVCSYPAALKAFHVAESSAIAMAREALARSQKSRGWRVRHVTGSTEELARRICPFRLEVQDEQRKARVDDTTVEDIVRTTNMLDVRGLARRAEHESDAVATYLIPYGTLGFVGTASDVLHASFDMHPVWLQPLMDEIGKVTTYDHSFYAREFARQRRTSPRHVQIEAVDALHEGQSMHPYMLQCTSRCIRLYLHKEPDALPPPPSSPWPPPDSDVKFDSIESLCRAINTDHRVSNVSGDIEQEYSTTMHNAERMLQACFVMGARAHVKGVSVLDGILLLPREHGLENAVACACIASAMSAVEIGGTPRMSIACDRESHSSSEGQRVVLHMKAMVSALLNRGVVSIPFREVCMLVSALCVRRD